MATEQCRVFTHSLGSGSWLEYKLVKDIWIRCVFLVMGDEVRGPRS